MTLTALSQNLKNTSLKNGAGEKVLRFEMTVPLNLEEAWNFFTKDDKLKKWIAPLAHIELKSGGAITTNYDSTKTLTDSSSIRLPIISYLDKELIIFKVDLNDHFIKKVRDEDENLQELIQFRQTGNNQTKIISSMIGWGSGPDWDKVYDFFAKGNEWTYKELLKQFPL